MAGGKAHNLLCGLPARLRDLPALAGTKCGALWSHVDRCLDQSRARLCRSRVRASLHRSESSKRVAAQEKPSTEGSKSKQKSKRNALAACSRGQIMYPEREITHLRTRSAVTWRLRPHNIVLVPAAEELASYHRCHVRASRAPLETVRRFTSFTPRTASSFASLQLDGNGGARDFASLPAQRGRRRSR